MSNIFDIRVFDIRGTHIGNGREAAENRKMVWIPSGFAHGFAVLSDHAEFLYKTTDYVFNGTQGAPYTEDDAPCPINVPLGSLKCHADRGADGIHEDVCDFKRMVVSECFRVFVDCAQRGCEAGNEYGRLLLPAQPILGERHAGVRADVAGTAGD